MPRERKYLAHAQSACTFADLFRAYLRTWPQVAVEANNPKWSSTDAYAGHLLGVAYKVAARFPTVDVWDYLHEALQHSMKWYDPAKGPFDKLFERNVWERLKKATVREAEATSSRARRERCAAEAKCRKAETDDVAAAYERWSRHLFEQAVARLDPQTRAYIRHKLEGVPVKDIARLLKVREKTLWNKYGGVEKLALRVRQQVRQLVLELPGEHRDLLVRHLLDEAGLSRSQVEQLLGVPLGDDYPADARLLDEQGLLEALGWASEPISDFSPVEPGRFAARNGVRPTETLDEPEGDFEEPLGVAA